MEQDNRVLSRKGARELTGEEPSHVHGALGTLHVCSAPRPSGPQDPPSAECPG